MRILGPVLLVVGLAFIIFGINSAQTIPEQIVEGATGRYTSQTMYYIIGGIAMLAGGYALYRGNGNRI